MVRLLIVDDFELMREIVIGSLDAARIDVVGEADNGQVAVDLVNLLMPDVVLLDIQMPIADGFEALRMMKSMRPDLTVLMHSADDTPECLCRSYELGASGFIVKTIPYNASLLSPMIHDAFVTGDVWNEDQLELIRFTERMEIYDRR